MPIDIPNLVYGANLDVINAGINAYNAAISGGTLTGCQACGAALDNRGTGRLENKLSSSAPTDFPQVRLISSGGNEQKSVTQTFGMMQGKSCDAIIPKIVTLDMSIMYDGGVTSDSGTTPLEAYIDAAYHAPAYYPKLGISYVRFFAFNDRRKDEKVNGVTRTVFRRQITVDLWPHLSVYQ